MENLLENIDNYVIILDYKGNIKFCNNKLLNKINFNKENILDKSIHSILINQVDPFLELGKENIEIQLQINNKDIFKLSCKVMDYIFNTEKCIIILGTDISTYNVKDLEDLLDSIPMAVWINDLNGNYIYLNDYVCSGFNKDKETLRGSKYTDNFPPELLGYHLSGDKEIVKYKTPLITEETININQISKHFECYKMPILDSEENVKYIAGISRDISLNKVLEREMFNIYNKFSSLTNLLYTEYEDEKKYLNKICEEIGAYLSSDVICLLQYDELKSELIPYISISDKEQFLKTSSIKVDTKESILKYNNGILSHISKVPEANYCKYRNLKNMEYLGIYNICINEDLYGIMVIGYEKGKVPNHYLHSLLKNLCIQIAINIKNKRLSLEIKSEYDKRFASEKELELFLDTAVDLVAIVDGMGKFTKINSKWFDILGWSSEELIGSDIRNLLHPDDLNSIMKLSTKEERTKSIENLRQRYISKCGSYVWIYLASKYIEESDTFIVTGRDISKEVYIDEQTKKLDKAIELESIKSEFYSNISHELKTPINIILGSIQLMNQGVTLGNLNKDKINKHIKITKQNSYRLLRLVNNFVDISKIETGFYKLYLVNQNIVKIIEDITMSVVNYVEPKNINLIFDTNTECEIVACDPDKVERIMLNLLSNAIKYTSENGEIIVTLNSCNDYLSISVRDNGTGIPKDKLDTIFDRFLQVEDSLVKKREGSGIGLSLVKHLVEMHGGTIQVKSELDNGSEFIFTIPKVQTKEESEIKYYSERSNIEKCSIEFSDIYNI